MKQLGDTAMMTPLTKSWTSKGGAGTQMRGRCAEAERREVMEASCGRPGNKVGGESSLPKAAAREGDGGQQCGRAPWGRGQSAPWGLRQTGGGRRDIGGRRKSWQHHSEALGAEGREEGSRASLSPSAFGARTSGRLGVWGLLHATRFHSRQAWGRHRTHSKEPSYQPEASQARNPFPLLIWLPRPRTRLAWGGTVTLCGGEVNEEAVWT